MLRTRKPLVAALVALPLALAGCAGGGSGGGDSDDKTLTIWHYESETSAMGQAWAKAIEIFEDENPDVTVDVQKQTFEQIQKNAKIVLTGDDVPDVMEYNKGNATAGQLASQGLLTPLTDAAKERGWDTTLSGSLQTTATYDENGLMGSGEWYGVPNYGEFVGVYYNKDMFAQYGVQVPTTLAELETAMATFQAAGVTPLAEAGAEYPLGQLWYELVLANADQDFVDAYQLFDGDVDFQGPEMTEATETLADWIDKGYIASDSAALTAEDMGVSFINGTYPMMVSGSWWFGRIVDEMDADWGQFNFPGNTLQVGSSATCGSSRPTPTPSRSPRSSSTSRCAPRCRTSWARPAGSPSRVTSRRSRTSAPRPSRRTSTTSWPPTVSRSTPTGLSRATTTCS